ncbi:MAG TPA: tagaturonate reductase [Candidatus Sulfotelmatobacter sp.]|nr:tagaturonate reductase [Candidatus Sulfotelmatobacter sp.]
MTQPKAEAHAHLDSGMLASLGERGIEVPPSSSLDAPETILQLGFGKFLRGFTPDFVQLANAAGHYRGRILAVQRESDYRSAAAQKQGGLYTLILRGLENGSQIETKRVIGSVSRLVPANHGWEEIKAAVRRRSLRVVVTNATETGLRLDSTERADAQPPRSFAGKLTRLLYERWLATQGEDADIAVIPTELVLDNGAVVHRLLVEQAQAWRLDDGFVDWLRASVHVASTLVDRIVVGTPGEQVLREECAAVGYHDELLTCGEPYYLFAIQADEFTRHHFPMHISTPNVCFVDDLGPYRRRKLRLLNGPQMVLSTLGTYLDFTLVRDTVRDPQLGEFTQQTIWQEIIPAMGTEEERVNGDYARECYQRIGNPTIEHRLQGIRMDLTTKNAIRLFPSVRDFMARRKEMPGRILLTLAATLAVALKIQLQDVNAEFIASRWAATDEHSSESLYAFSRDALTRLSEASHEELDVNAVAPTVADLLRSIRKEGLRPLLSRVYGLNP